MARNTRIFQPQILATKEELMIALKDGQISSSKYHSLDEDEKLFVEMVVFGNYTGAQAMKVIKPELSNYTSSARRMMARQNIDEVMEELTYKRDKLWLARITGARDTAFGIMEYVMKTTNDENLKVATAKEIVKAAGEAVKNNKRPEDTVQGITFNFEFAPSNPGPNTGKFNPDDVVIIDAEPINPATGMEYRLDYVDQVRGNYRNDGIPIIKNESEETE